MLYYKDDWEESFIEAVNKHNSDGKYRISLSLNEMDILSMYCHQIKVGHEDEGIGEDECETWAFKAKDLFELVKFFGHKSNPEIYKDRDPFIIHILETILSDLFCEE